MRNYLALFGLFIVITSCQKSGSTREEQTQNPELQEETNLYTEVIRMHDEIMPRLQTISNLKSQVEERITRLEEAEVPDNQRIVIFRDQMIALDSADEAMMDWMRNFIADHEGWEHDSIMSYLTDENARILEIGEIIDKTTAKTNDLLSQE